MKLAVVAHCHQPIGNFGWVVEDAVDRAYVPFLETVAEVAGMRVGLHYSGTLLGWVAEHRPDLLDLIRDLSDQVELLTGGLHEPILTTLPPDWQDRQIQAHRRLLEETFGVTATGMWLTERIWESNLAATMARNDIDYTLVDDTLFEIGGAPPDKPAVVDYLGQTVRVLPISRELRHAVPTSDVDEVMSWLQSAHEANPAGTVVAADDGEKFGAWEDPDSRVHERGWLRELFTAITEAPWIELVSPAEAASTDAVPGVLGSGSYSEMNHWLTEAKDRAWPAPWQRFLVRYPEANVMYRKMLTLAKTPKLADAAVGDVLAAQANDAYWHGAFGGVYFPHLRAAVQDHLIAARIHVDGGHRSRSWCDLSVTDWDGDGSEEIHAEFPDQSWVLHSGGAFHYYDDKPKKWSVADVVARRREDHHEDPGQYDGLPRNWLLDRISGRDAQPGQLFEAHGGPVSYELETADVSRATAHIVLTGAIPGGGSVVKTIVAHDRQIELSYTLEDVGSVRFGPELPVSVWARAARLRVDGGSWQDADTPLAETGHRFRFEHAERAAQVVVDLRLPGAIFAVPIITEIRSEAGTDERVFQGVALWPHFLVDGSGTYTMTITIDDVKRNAE